MPVVGVGGKQHWNFKDITGRVFGHLTVIGLDHIDDHRTSYWLCKCDCGKEKSIARHQLIRGQTGCGCRKGQGQRRFFKIGAAAHHVYCQYVRGARDRNIPWKLNKDDFLRITSSDCFYTGRKPSTVAKSQGGDVYIYNGIDRLDSAEGYTVENCVPCCSVVNMMKKRLSYRDFIGLCEEISAHLAVREVEKFQL